MPGRKSKYYVKENINKTWNCGLYIRLSQEDDDILKEDKLESNSVTGQKTLLKEFVNENEDLKIYDIYIDDGFTGTDFNRPSFQRLLEDVKNGLLNCIIVKDLSRLGRNYIEVGNYIEQVFPLFNIRFIAINDNVDSYKNPSSTNTILVPFKNLINDEYCRDTSVKIRSSLNSKKRKGEFIGAFCSYGYLKDEKDKHKLVIDETAAIIVRKIFDWNVNLGMGKIAISHKLNDLGILNPTGHKRLELGQNYNNSGIKNNKYLWTPSTIGKILTNEVYIGNTVQGKRRTKSYKIHKVENIPQEEWIKVENTHEKIIEKEIFEKAKQLSKIDTKVQKSGILSIWAGLLKCGDCGFSMHKKVCKNKNGKIYEYYICSTYKKKSKVLCTKHSLKIEELNKTILAVIKNQIAILANIPKVIRIFEDRKKDNFLFSQDFQKIKNDKKTKIENIKNLKRFLYEDWKNGDISKEEYHEYKEKYENDIRKLELEIENINLQEKDKKADEIKKTEWIEDFKNNNISKLDREVLLELIEYIEVFENNKIKVHLKFTK